MLKVSFRKKIFTSLSIDTKRNTSLSLSVFIYEFEVTFFFFTIPLIDIFEDRLEKFLNLIKFTAPSVKKLFSSSDNFSS